MADARTFPRDRVTVMGVLNVTADSFFDGGRFVRDEFACDVNAAVAAGRRLADDGAHVIDVGGESTRPGAASIDPALEIARTAPVIRRLADTTAVPISIDTRKAEVAAAALEAGARIVNDVSGGEFDPDLLGVTARAGAELVLGHLRGVPETMQESVFFEDVVSEVADELARAVARAEAAGVARERLVVDPGIGFGKRAEHSLVLLANVASLRERLGLPVLVGPSRKSFLGEVTGDPVDRREAAGLAACAVAVYAGADAVRTHDVRGTVRAVAVAAALRDARRKCDR